MIIKLGSQVLRAPVLSSLIVDTVYDVCGLIMTDKSSNNLKELDIVLVRGLADLGSCHMVTKSDFKIELKYKLPVEVLISTIVHELVHVNQFMEGRLKIVNNCFSWNGKLYNSIYTDEEYFAFPWEVEARNVESAYKKISERRQSIYLKGAV